MRKRMIMAVAAGVVAGATVVGVPALAYAGGDSPGGGVSGADMGSMMEDPALLERAKAFMSEMMSDPTLQEEMRSMMGDMGDMGEMGDMSGMSDMEGMGDRGDGSAEEVDPGNP